MASTLYNTWHHVMGDLSPDDDVVSYVGEFIDDFDVGAIQHDYRAAIDAVLPPGLLLTGDQFIGPVPDNDGDESIDVDWEAVREDISGIDLAQICQRHDLTH